LLLFIVRSVLQWRNTGSAGFNGFSGRAGSLEWFAGVCATAGLLLAPAAAIAAMLHWPAGELLFSHAPTQYFGVMLAIVGIIGALFAQLNMGSSWRIGVNPQERTELITSGLYRWMRNPIFTFIGLSMTGFALIVPNLPAMLALALGIIGIQLQVRYVNR
jgi:protein-S-isoprenylcysteine O-methyltransferase Ste14